MGQAAVEGRAIDFELHRRRGGPPWLAQVPGFAMIAFGVAILLWPALLAYLVAVAFIAGGLGLAVLPRRLRR